MSEWRLVLETSGRVGKVGLGRGNELIYLTVMDEKRRHARDLTEVIRQLLSKESLTPSRLGAVAVSIGPGGYTGLRVGLTTAKVLAYAAGVPMIAVPTFAAVAEQAPAEAERLWVVADALQGSIYLQRFETQDGQRQPLDELRIVPVGEWLPWANREVWVTGPGVSVHADKLPCNARVVPPADRDPRLDGVLRAAEGFTPLDRDELMRIEPLYLRGSSAEEKAKRDRA
jgi:tRNA threonylcarbamoyladenosine biosynthesis protein TsaB